MGLLDRCVGFFQLVLYINTSIVAIPYFVLLVTAAAFFNTHRPPSSFFSSSDSPLNRFFFKYTYWYILGLLLPFVFCLHLVYGFGKKRTTVGPLIRVLVNFAILLILGYEFNVIASLIGDCANSTFNNEEFECQTWGYKWKPLDISGHIFHNFYGILAVTEETRYFKLWPLVETVVDGVLKGRLKRKVVARLIENEISVHDQRKLIDMHRKVSTVVKMNFCLLGILVIGLHLANISTVIYFHTFAENLIAAAVALFLWLLCYKLVYPLYGIRCNSFLVYWPVLPIYDNDDEELISQVPKFAEKSYGTV